MKKEINKEKSILTSTPKKIITLEIRLKQNSLSTSIFFIAILILEFPLIFEAIFPISICESFFKYKDTTHA
jgi:hypothetical protein